MIEGPEGWGFGMWNAAGRWELGRQKLEGGDKRGGCIKSQLCGVVWMAQSRSNVILVESVCEDPEIIQHNIRSPTLNPQATTHPITRVASPCPSSSSAFHLAYTPYKQGRSIAAAWLGRRCRIKASLLQPLCAHIPRVVPYVGVEAEIGGEPAARNESIGDSCRWASSLHSGGCS
jgi:hypothetical protein